MTLIWDPVLAARLHHLDGVGQISFGDGPEIAEKVAAFHAAVPGYAAPDVEAEDLAIPGPRGPIDARIYRPAGEPTRAIAWVHGGAFMFGDLDMPEADVVARELCARAAALVVSLDYRKTVDGAHYPVGQDDVYAAWLWLNHEFAEWSGTWSLGGGSAGASLSMATMQRARHDGETTPDALLLIYPGGHAVMPDGGPEFDAVMAQVPPRLTFPPEVMARIRANYIGDYAGPLTYAHPADGDLEGFPPTLIVNCEFDSLRASGEQIARDLEANGTDVSCVLESGVMHGHLNIPGLPTTLKTFDRMVDFLAAKTAQGANA